MKRHLIGLVACIASCTALTATTPTFAAESTVTQPAVTSDGPDPLYDGTYILVNVATGLCIDDSAAGLRDFACQNPNGTNAKYQEFKYLPAAQGISQ
jgi:hypothetical protein